MSFFLLVALLVSPFARADENTLPEIRRAKAIVKIDRLFVERNEGGIAVRREVVCRFEGTVPVFDGRERSQWSYSFGQPGSCKTQWSGKEIELVVLGAIAYSGFAKEPHTLKKMATATLGYLYAGTEPFEGLNELHNSFGSRDLNQTSFLAQLDPDYWTGSSDERFSAEVEFVDNEK